MSRQRLCLMLPYLQYNSRHTGVKGGEAVYLPLISCEYFYDKTDYFLNRFIFQRLL